MVKGGGWFRGGEGVDVEEEGGGSGEEGEGGQGGNVDVLSLKQLWKEQH